MNKIVVSIVLAVLSLMVTIVSFIINDIAAYRGQISEHLENKGKTPPPGGNRSLPPGKTEHHERISHPDRRP